MHCRAKRNWILLQIFPKINFEGVPSHEIKLHLHYKKNTSLFIDVKILTKVAIKYDFGNKNKSDES